MTEEKTINAEYHNGGISYTFPTSQTQAQMDDILSAICWELERPVNVSITTDTTYHFNHPRDDAEAGLEPVPGTRKNQNSSVLVATTRSYDGQLLQIISRTNERLEYEQLEIKILQNTGVFQSNNHQQKIILEGIKRSIDEYFMQK